MVAEDRSFGRLLKRFRRSAQQTQQDLAERAGFSPHYISMLERGVRLPRPETVDGLAAALGLAPAERMALLDAAGDRAAASPPVTPAASAGPPPLGREQEIADIMALLGRAGVRLLTLIGPGGVGKTRLARYVAARLASSFNRGTAFVDLSVLSDPESVITALARVFRLGDMGQLAPLDGVISFLRDKQLLLLLDSCERVLNAAPVFADLLQACPRLTILATSRAPLGLRNEQEFPVQPLALPGWLPASAAGDLAGYPALDLFVQRARLVRPDFQVGEPELLLILDICRRVDGLPLAIELAAARIKHLTLPALRDRLEHRLRVLTGGWADLPVRHQRMWETISWSYDLLRPAEQQLLRQLAVFAGTWSLQAAEAICQPGYVQADVLDGLRTLVDHSLVSVATGTGSEPCYRLLDTIREFAEEQLAATPEAEIVRRRHAEYYIQLADQAEPALQGAGQGAWYQRLEQEDHNIRAAIIWLLQSGEHALALRLAGAIWRFWQRQGTFREGRRWLEAGLAGATAVPVAVHARALWGASWLAYHQGDYARAAALSATHLALADAHGDLLGRRNALTGLGMVALAEGRPDAALQPLQESLDLCQSCDNPWHLATSYLNLGIATTHVANYQQARQLLEQACSLYQTLGDDTFASRARSYLGYVALLQGDHGQAQRLFEQSLQEFYQRSDQVGIVEALEGLAAVFAATRRVELAVRLAAAAATLREQMAAQPLPFDRAICQRYLDDMRQLLAAERWAALWAEGRALSMKQAVACVLAGA